MDEENADGSRTQTSNDVFLTDYQEIFHRAAQVLNSSSWHQKKPGSQKASICLWPCLILEFSFSLEAGLGRIKNWAE